MSDNDDNPRTFTDEQSSDLRSKLLTCLINQQSEDANDLLDYALAMITNGKTVEYIVNDLKNMGMDHICDGDASERIGKTIDLFLRGASASASAAANTMSPLKNRLQDLLKKKGDTVALKQKKAS
mmetsp:Transcript_24131/g.35938  ORF Transcript_24131/g.35938 Transcript_24131/m.35938 type:complete len:125 (-) Transcript_24131:1858-2232(-)